MTAAFIIDPEFQALIPPLTAAERAALEASIRAEGCRHALVVWKETGILLDGHNRHEICQAAGLPFTVTEISIVDRAEAMAWIIRSALAQRSLTPAQKIDQTLKLEDIIAEKAKAKQRQAGGPLPQKSAEPPIETRVEVARAAGVSHDTIRKFKIIKEHAPKETLEKVLRGEMTINSAFQKVDNAQRIAAIHAKAAAEPPPPLGSMGVYRCVYLDPPWKYENDECAGAAALEFETLSDEKIAALPIPRLLHPEGAHVWMWVTWPVFQRGTHKKLLDAWGLRWASTYVWHKRRMGMGHWFRISTEPLIFAVSKGAVGFPRKNVEGFLSVKSGRHSEKPKEVATLIEELSPGPRIELFARAARAGWARWGLEAPPAVEVMP